MTADTGTPHQRPGPLAGLGRVLVVGIGVSGLAAARLLDDAGVSVRIVDERAAGAVVPPPLGERVEVRHLTDAGAALAGVDLVVPSPGVPEGAPILREAVRRSIPIWSEPELALRAHPHRLLAVTGTNGKTSTTELLAAMVAASGLTAVACGNIGLPLSEAAPAAPDDAVLVAELSSFQLRFAGTLRPEVGVLLNLSPDHLDWHADERAYRAAKARLWEAQGPDDWAVANADDAATVALREAAPGRHAAFSGTHRVETGVGVASGQLVGWLPDGTSTGPLTELASLGLAPHRVANTAAAATAALLAGVAPSAIADAVGAYRPGRHRYELVATSPSGVAFVDDSKATNPHAARAALTAGGPVVWIAGGLAKGLDLSVLAPDLAAVRLGVLIGDAAEELERVCGSVGVPSVRSDSIEDAVATAAAAAHPGDTVLLAPACASFDQFRDYAERGERFTAAARSAAGLQGAGFSGAELPGSGLPVHGREGTS